MTISFSDHHPSMIDIAQKFGLMERGVNGIKITPKILNDFQHRKLAFDWVHMGTTACKAGDIATIIRETIWFLPPRSGHAGNWADIAAGCAGAVDYNKILCADEKLAYPLIYDLNMTENDDLTEGDTIYLPGSYVKNGQRLLLPLYCWQGGNFVRADRRYSYLSPFVLIEYDHELMPLLSFHRQSYNHLREYHFKSQAAVIIRAKDLFQNILLALIKQAINNREPEHFLQLIFDRIVDVSGITRRIHWHVSQGTYWAGDVSFSSPTELVMAATLPWLAADNPWLLIKQPDFFSRPMLLCSLPLISLMLAVCNTHLTKTNEQVDGFFNLHAHWGAIGMAGYPPRKHGYFANQVRYARPIYQTVIRDFPEIRPVFFLLIPSAIYLLWPHQHYPNDYELVTSLLKETHDQTMPYLNKPNILGDKIDKITSDWLEKNIKTISPYFIRRFQVQRSVFNAIELPKTGRSIKPEYFDQLSLSQLSMLVGSITERLPKT